MSSLREVLCELLGLPDENMHKTLWEPLVSGDLGENKAFAARCVSESIVDGARIREDDCSIPGTEILKQFQVKCGQTHEISGQELLKRLDARMSLLAGLPQWASKGEYYAALGRIGLPIHYRLAYELAQSGDRESYEPAVGIWNELLKKAAQNDLLEEAAQKSCEIPESEAYWLWQHISDPKSIQEIAKTNTRIVLVTRPGTRQQEGVFATLTMRLVRWPSKPTPEHGFVPAPQSFGWIVRDEFARSFEATKAYLNNLVPTKPNEPGIWPEDLALEWNVSGVSRGPILTGGSAGAAIALAAGSLLAKHYRDRSKQS